MTGVDVRQANYDRIVGRDGWQFISKIDSIDEKSAGRIRLAPAEMRHWALTLESRAAWCARQGCAYHFMIAPNKSTVYPEFLPEEGMLSPERDFPALKAYLRAHSDFAMLDPVADLLAEKAARPVYFKTDEHWNAAGAFIAYRLLMREVAATVAVKALERDDLVSGSRPYIGGLEALAEDPTPEIIDGLRPRESAGKEVFVNKPKGRGKVQVYVNPRSDLPRAVMLRDSYGSFMLPFLAETFSRITVVSSRALLFDLVRFEKPDVVIHELCERYLDPVPDDIRSKSFADLCDVPLEALRGA